MTQLNMENRTLGVMDNLRFLRSLNNECIDLIAIDPPFATNETFTTKPKPPISEAELAEEKALAKKHGARHNEGIGETRVQDVWNWDEDVHPDWLSRIEDDYPPVHSVIQAVEACASENEAAYIAFMAVRLIECRRVLKDTGSIYVHCDDHANGYLRMLLDAVFGAKNFKNEIVWKRTAGRSDAKRFGRVHDSIYFYAKSNQFTWNTQYAPHDPDYVKRMYRHDDGDGRGRWRSADLTANGHGKSGGEYFSQWKGVNLNAGRMWNLPMRGGMADWIEQNAIPEWKAMTGVHNRLNALDEAGLIHWPKRGKMPSLKRYLSSTKGRACEDVLTDIGKLEYASSEKTGYSTQKPLVLYERIIRASSNPGDVVLDIFAGCATTAVAAENLDRRWIACDMAYRSWTMLKRRFALNGVALDDMTSATTDALKGKQPQMSRATSWTIGPNDLPEREDVDPEPFHSLAKPKRGKKSVRSSTWSGRIPKDEAKQILIDEFGAECWGCGWEAPVFPNGDRDLTLLEVDHIWAKRDASAAGGGNDELYNLALLHRTCNGIKGNRLTLEELRQKNADDQHAYKTVKDMVHIGKAIQFANERILQRGVQTAL